MMFYCQSCGSRAFQAVAGPAVGACAACGGRVWMSVPPFMPAPGLWLETVDAVAVDSGSLDRLKHDLFSSARPRRSRSRAQLRVIEGGEG